MDRIRLYGIAAARFIINEPYTDSITVATTAGWGLWPRVAMWLGWLVVEVAGVIDGGRLAWGEG